MTGGVRHRSITQIEALKPKRIAMSDIFISYARIDREKAQILAEALQRQGWSVWWDPNIPLGEKFAQIIRKELNTAKCVIVLWSKKSVESNWVLDEASEAVSRGVLVPALIEDVEIPLGFRQIQTGSLSNWKGDLLHAEFNRLLKDVAKIIWKKRELKPLTALDCNKEASLRSLNSDSPTELTFINTSHEVLKIYWIDFQGKRKLIAVLHPNESNTQSTFLTHPFVVADLSEKCLGIYLPDKEPSSAILAGNESKHSL